MSGIDPIVVDGYEGDHINPSAWTTLFLAGRPWCGAIMKASQGVTYTTPNFTAQWQGIKAGAGPRYGIDAFRGAYAYWSRSAPGKAQAQYYLDIVATAGGWSDGDLWPIIDIEAGGGNQGASAGEVIDGVSAFAEEILAQTGRKPMAYAGSFCRDLQIKNHMGCQLLWTPCYGPALPPSMYTALGYGLGDTWGWQYREAGGKTAPPKGYPSTSPIGDLDATAVIINGGGNPDEVIAWTRAHLGTHPA